ncbi:MAG: twin-arginine translocation signal domain-containing protein [Anaerolineales bacterium]|nr:twin-arginine translocation signal domain-containing protein [Anaerolineales bacterium]
MDTKKSKSGLSRRDFLKGTFLTGAAGVLAACNGDELAGTTTAAPTVAEGPVSGGELFVGEVMDPLIYDPHAASSEWVTNLSEKVCEKLVYTDPADATIYRPGLAESWEVSSDGTSITFNLRDDVKFHDGTPFNAEAVKFNLDRIVDPATQASIARSILGPYTGTEVIDDYTAKVMFAAPYAPGLDSFSQGFLAMVSPAAVEKYGEDFPRNVVGTGPFMWSEYVRDDHITMINNPEYKWASPIFSNSGPAYLDKVTYRLVADHNTRAGMLRSGQLHILEGVPEVQVESFEDEGYNVFAKKPPGFPGAALINTERFPTDDVNVRQALNYGTDREAIAKAVWFDVWPMANGPLTKATWAYDPAVEDYHPYDPQKAAQILEGSGWTMGDDGIRVKDGNRLEVSLIYAIGTWTWTELFQAQMKEIGVDVQVLQLDMLAAGEASANGEANISPNVISASDPSILGLLFHSRMIGMFNWTYYKDDELDTLLDVAVTQMDRAERAASYSEIQKIIMDQALIIPLAETVILFVQGPEVQDTINDPRGLPMYFQDTWLKGEV